MNRAERRRTERNIKKNIGAINDLTPAQVKLIDIAATERSKKYTEEFTEILDRTLTSVLLDQGWNLKKVREIQNEIANLMYEDAQKIDRLKKENVDMAKVEKEVREYIKGLIEKGVNKKEALEELQFKFNKMSKSMLNVAYCKVKEEIEAEEKAAEQIVNIIEGTERGKEALKKEIAKREITETKKEVEKAMSKESKLKVLSMCLEGNNGKYRVCENGVELTNEGMMMSFKNIEELDKFTEEFREVFGMMK